MAANTSGTFAPNGGPVGGAKPGIQFGFDSPAMAQSTPQSAAAAPIPIPGGNNSVPSPANSPSPIPQPSASGGRPPAGLQQSGSQMTFGSLPSDGERHVRQGSVPQAGTPNQAGTHFRRESNHSVQGDNNRGNYQGGRGRGYNPNYNNQMGYPPANQYRNGPGQGRGMPPSFQPQGRNMAYPNSPQANRSPAPVPSLPGTPNMPPANIQMQTPPQYHYPPPMAPQQNYGYPPQQMDQYGRPMNMPYYNNMGGYMPPQGNAGGYNQQFVPPAYHQPGQSMSRSPSQAERPSSANQQQPAIVSSTPQGTPAKPSTDFVKPRRSAAIQIKNAAGEVVDTSAFKQSASPAPAQTKTPPVAAPSPSPAPAPKPVVPAAPVHARSDSQATPKTAKEIQDELKAKIKQATQGSANQEEKPKAETPAAPEAAPEKPKEEPKETPKAAPKPAEEAKPAAPAASASADPDEEEIERMIREMEEADAKREAEEEEHRKRREAEKAADKLKDEANRKANAEEEDRKLREQEREMERLEEEKEKKRAAAESSGKTLSVAEALAAARDGKSEEDNVDEVTDKLAGMDIADKAGADKRSKPAALNLTPINTKPVEPAQPTPAMQSLKSARFLDVIAQDLYPEGIKSPNPALNAAVAKKGKTFRYDSSFLLQFQKVFTETPSLEFHQQVKSLLGDDGGRSASRSAAPGSARQGSRGGPGFPGGPFNAPPGRSGGLPKSASGVNPMAAFQRPGAAFPAPGMVRSGSNKNMSNTRQGSRSTRNSRRTDIKEAQAAKTMPLTAGQDIKPIAITSTGWKPTSVGRPAQPGAAGASGYLDPEMVQRKVKAALNKMTPENFDRIAEQILVIASQSKDETDGRTLRQVIQLTFEKATDEAHWASMYAKFCKRMLEAMNPDVRDERIKDKNGNVVTGGNLFRKYLLNRCQEEFERGWTVNLPEPPKEGEEGAEKPAAAEGEAEGEDEKKAAGEAALLSDEYYIAAAAKRRGLGLVQFIGELYKLGMLTERIMHECVRKLVDYKGIPDEAEVESLCKLLRTIGANLDETEKGRPMMDAYFQRIQNMVDLPEMASRIKFMLMDVIDLRKARWISKEADKGPKTLEEVRAEAEAQQAAKAQEAARTNQRGGGRPPVGRGDARNFSGGYQQQTSNQVGMDDLRRLKGSINRTSSQNVTLGPTSMFSSRSNSGRRMGPGGSLGRPGDDSGVSSRAATPPTNTNAFSLLANMETETPASPPSAAASPALAKAEPAGDDEEKKESDE